MIGTLSNHLLQLAPQELQIATQHPFLVRAAHAALPQKLLVAWIAQDRLYALSYLTLASQLLSKLTVPSTSDRTSTLNWRIGSCLIDCLANIRQELALFEDVAEKNGWMEQLGEATPSIQTQAYKDLFAGVGQPNASLLKGVVTLWATEKCYLEAWSFAAKNIPRDDNARQKSDVMQSIFIPNWSSAEFGDFVNMMEGLVNELGKDASVEDIKEIEVTWRQILWAEEAFWPKV